jgi:hypothetical protein
MFRESVVDGLTDAITMITDMEGQIKKIDRKFIDGIKVMRRQFGLPEEESVD